MLSRVAKGTATLYISAKNSKNKAISVLLDAINNKKIANNLSYKLAYSFVNIGASSKYYNTNLPNLIQPCIAIADKQQNINEKLYILQHIAQISMKNPKFIKYDLQQFMIKNLSLWKNRRGRFQRVATVAWMIQKIKLTHRLKDLYDQIINRIQNDQWYVNFDESVKAIEAYANYHDEEKKHKVFQKIQRNLNITLTDVNMTYYQRISQSLMQAQRGQSPIWSKLQHFVIRNLSMDYSPKTFFDILKAFIMTCNGSALFYEMCQQVIHKGHLYNKTHKLRNNLGDFDSTGDYFAMVVETYALVNRQSLFPISSDFLDYLYKSMLASRVQYHNISSLTKLINHMPQLQFHSMQINKIVKDVIENKEFTEYHSLADIQQLYDTMEQKMGDVPDKLMSKVESLVKKDMDRHLLPLPNAIQLVGFLLKHRQNQQKQDATLIQSLNKSIQKKFKYIGIQQQKKVIQLLRHYERVQQKVEKIHLLPIQQIQANRQQRPNNKDT